MLQEEAFLILLSQFAILLPRTYFTRRLNTGIGSYNKMSGEWELSDRADHLLRSSFDEKKETNRLKNIIQCQLLRIERSDIKRSRTWRTLERTCSRSQGEGTPCRRAQDSCCYRDRKIYVREEKPGHHHLMTSVSSLKKRLIILIIHRSNPIQFFFSAFHSQYKLTWF